MMPSCGALTNKIATSFQAASAARPLGWVERSRPSADRAPPDARTCRASVENRADRLSAHRAEFSDAGEAGCRAAALSDEGAMIRTSCPHHAPILNAAYGLRGRPGRAVFALRNRCCYAAVRGKLDRNPGTLPPFGRIGRRPMRGRAARAWKIERTGCPGIAPNSATRARHDAELRRSQLEVDSAFLFDFRWQCSQPVSLPEMRRIAGAA